MTKITSKIFFVSIIPLLIFDFSEIFILISVETNIVRIINYIIFGVTAILSIWLGYKNHKTENSILWYCISAFSALFSIGYIYIVYSLSNFGF